MAELEDHVLQVGGIALNEARYDVRCNNRSIYLTLSEFRLLARLMNAPGQVVSRECLLETIANGSIVCSHNLDVRVSRLRKKLGHDGRAIVTVKGEGYKIVNTLQGLAPKLSH